MNRNVEICLVHNACCDLLCPEFFTGYSPAQLIRTLKFTATYLKCVSLLDFSLRAAWAGHWLFGRPKKLKREKSRAELQQQILPTTNKCPY